MNGNNGTPPEPSGGEAVEVDMARVMGDRIATFAGRPITAADMNRLLEIMIREQAQLEEMMMPTAVDLKARLTHPFWAIELTSPNYQTSIGLMAHKLIQDVFSLPPEKQADAALRAASMLALISDGMTARAVLKIFGFQYRFAQAKGSAESRIIVPT